MKFYKLLISLIAITVLVAPAAALRGGRAAKTPDIGKASSAPPQEITAVPGSPSKAAGIFKVLLTDSGKVIAVDAREYVIGSVAAEMTAASHEEALKAQAIACYTYAVRKRAEQTENPSEELKGAHISDSGKTHQGYLTASARKNAWGGKAEAYEEKITAAVKAVFGKIITFDGEPILAAYHHISCGRTLDAQTVWGEDIPYLRSVSSAADKLSPDCTQSLVFTPAQFEECAAKLGKKAPEGDCSEWLGKSFVTDEGYVEKIEICGEEYTGRQVREAFGLRSAVFEAKYKNDSFTFETAGYGHGVGMSQYGADYMARLGSTCEEILRHYYIGIEITQLTPSI